MYRINIVDDALCTMAIQCVTVLSKNLGVKIDCYLCEMYILWPVAVAHTIDTDKFVVDAYVIWIEHNMCVTLCSMAMCDRMEPSSK